MKQKIIVPTDADAAMDHYLSKRGYEVITCANPGEDDILRLAPDAAAVMMVSRKLSNDLYDQMPNLKILARRGVGYDNIDVDYAGSKGVWVTNTPGANARAVAEAALMDILMLARNIPQMTARARTDGWSAAAGLHGHEIGGATVGIVGYGNVGRALAAMLNSLGVRVLIYNRHPRETTDGTFVSWDELFKQSDYVSLHLAATPETMHSVGAREFNLMKPTAGLVNLARGSVVDEPALIDALQNGTIAAAALDVFDQEPLPADSLFWQMENVLVTPHIGADTIEAGREMALTAAKMIDDVLSGKKPEFAVNEVKTERRNTGEGED